eukprot:COSAG06_NODE_15164_length_1093_cov_0.983903_1_plen_107_part_10
MNAIFLPRQARDKHRESARKRLLSTVVFFFSQVAQTTPVLTIKSVGGASEYLAKLFESRQVRKQNLDLFSDAMRFYFMLQSNFCPDRLGRNIGKSTQKRGLRFLGRS